VGLIAAARHRVTPIVKFPAEQQFGIDKRMNELISKVRVLQKERVLPQGQLAFDYSENEASFSCRLYLGRHNFFLKKIKPRFSDSNGDFASHLEREFEALKKFSIFFQDHAHFSVPSPVYFSSDHLFLITEEVKGNPFQGIVNQYARRKESKNNNAIELCRTIGKFLKALHESESYPFTIGDLGSLVEYIKRRLCNSSFCAVDETKILKYLEKTTSEIGCDLRKLRKCPVHHDFNPSNVLVDGKNVNVVDFCDYQIDHPFQDIVYFKLMLGEQLKNRFKYRQSAKSSLILAFNQGCDWNYVGGVHGKLYKLYLLKNLAIFVKTLSLRIKEKSNISHFSARHLKDTFIDRLDLYITKRKIIELVTNDMIGTY